MNQLTVKVAQGNKVANFNEIFKSDVIKKEGIEGIEVSLYGDDEDDKLMTSQYGQIGNLQSKVDPLITVVVSIPSHLKASAITVDGKKNVTFKKVNYVTTSSGEKRRFQMRVQIKTSNLSTNAGINHTEYPENAMRLIVFKSESIAEMFEIGLISQAGDFFIMVVKSYTIALFQKDGKMVCPIFYDRKEPRPTFEKAVVGTAIMYGIKPETLPPISDYIQSIFTDDNKMLKAVKELPARTDKKRYGYVAFYNPIQRLGMLYVQGEKKPISVHEESLSGYGLKKLQAITLEAGDKVLINGIRKKQNTTPRGSGFSREAYGVRKVEN